MIGREGQWTRLEFPFVSSWRSIVSCACFGLPYNTHRSRLKILTPNRLTLSSYFFLSAVSFKWYPKRLRPAPAGGAAVAAATAPVHTTTAATAAAAAAEATKTSGEGVDGRRSSLGCLSDVAVGGWDITIAPSLQVIYSTAVSFVQPGGKRNNRPLKQHPGVDLLLSGQLRKGRKCWPVSGTSSALFSIVLAFCPRRPSRDGPEMTPPLYLYGSARLVFLCRPSWWEPRQDQICSTGYLPPGSRSTVSSTCEAPRVAAFD